MALKTFDLLELVQVSPKFKVPQSQDYPLGVPSQKKVSFILSLHEQQQVAHAS